MSKSFLLVAISATFSFVVDAQVTTPKANDVNTPLHLLQPDYPVPYNPPSVQDVEKIATRIYNYLDANTFPQLIHRSSRAAVTTADADTNSIFKPGDFRLTSYEWGVTYSGMLRLGEVTGNTKYTEYTTKRLGFIADIAPVFKQQLTQYPAASNPLLRVLRPMALDDAGAICASMIKSFAYDRNENLRPLINNFIDFISKKEFRLADGTLARNRPQPNTIWLDDLYMSIPALAQMGKFTGQKMYTDDAVKQLLQFSRRMFVEDKGLYMHGWVQGMQVHPAFHWGRANGWALLATVELLDVLPENHPSRKSILALLQKHIRGLAAFQSGKGFWHQLLDRNDSYLETSATAIYAYCIARAMNKGWIDPVVYGPMTLLAWNAVSTMVNDKGQVEGTCVGTGMGFEPAFYYYRPVNVFAAHGYGPVLLAAAEMITLLKTNRFKINDSAIQYYAK